ARRGMLDAEPWAVAELHRLARQREGAGNHGLRRDDGRHRRERDQGVQAPARGEKVEGVPRRGRGTEQERPLAEVVEQQARECHAEPRDLDRAVAEVAEGRVQGLPPVTTRKTAPSTTNPRPTSSAKTRTAGD